MSFSAKFEGVCARNRDQIYVGDLIEYNDAQKVVHVECDEESDARFDAELSQLDRDALRPVCPECFLIQPCECEPWAAKA